MKAFKKIIIIAIMGLGLSLASHSAKAQLFWIGVNGGANMSWFNTPGIDNALVSVGGGWNLGFFMRYGKKPFYQIDFRWIRANNFLSYTVDYNLEELDTSFSVTYEGDVPFHQFEIPIRVGYPIIYTPIFKWHVNGGPFISTTFMFSSNIFEIERNDMRNPQIGFMAGTGIQFMNFIIDIDYSYHLTELFKGDEEDLGVDFKAHLQLVSLKVGFQF